ncbi:MAG: NAD kinase [Cytophagales bacterium]|nr:NAD kinase [Cytophagales bacterium]
MKVALHGKEFSEEATPFMEDLLATLAKYQTDLFVSERFFTFLETTSIQFPASNVFTQEDDLTSFNLMISMGGNGTLLETITYVGDTEIPILGINTGRLGFLATVPKEDIAYALANYFNGDYVIDDRTLIRWEADPPILEKANFALNEITILKKGSSSMITVHAFIDGEPLNVYWADGLIIATPTGSTGYSLSCGGPVVLPQSTSLLITPISPHNLTLRPLVVPDKSVLTFKVESRNKKFLVSFDSRSKTVETNVKLTIRKEVFKAKLIKIGHISIFDTLRQKLHWGLDVRN